MFLVSKHLVVRLPMGLQVIKDHFDSLFLDQSPSADPDYNLDKFIEDLGLLEQGLSAEDILVIDCPHCGQPSYYDGGVTDFCSCCGAYNLADLSSEAYTLTDYWATLDDCRYWRSDDSAAPEGEKV